MDAGGSDDTRKLGRFLPFVVLVVLLAVALGLAQMARNVVHDQEDRMLAQRASEADAYLESFMGTFAAQLGTLAAVSAVGHLADLPVFAQAAEAMLQADDNIDVLALVLPDEDGRHVVEASAGPAAPPPGDVLLGRAADALDRVDQAMVTTPIFEAAGSRRIGLAVPLGFVPGAVYVEAPADVAAAAEDDADAPFTDLAVTLFVGPEARDDQRLIETTPPPGAGAIEKIVEVGDEQWLMLVDARSPLTGSVARNLPLIVLLAGLAVAAAVAALVGALARRQDAVNALVAERTGQLEAAQAELIDNERLAAVGQLATAIGHELRNPLGVLTNVNYLLRKRLTEDGDEHALRQVEIAEREVASATLIVSDLLEFARPRQPVPGEVRLDELVAEATSVAPPPPGVEVVTRELDGTVITGDRGQLRQVVLNLLTNAYDAMPDGGAVTISGGSDQRGQRLTVADDGIGMDAGQAAAVFEPFVTNKAKGIGLGLSVSQRIVEAHGGTLEVHSEPGVGTRFDIVLPAGDRIGAS